MANTTVLERQSLAGKSTTSVQARLGRFLVALARRKPLGFAGLVVVTAMIILALRPSLVAPNDPAETNVGPRFQSFCLGPQGSALCPDRVERSPLTGQDRVFSGSLSEP